MALVKSRLAPWQADCCIAAAPACVLKAGRIPRAKKEAAITPAIKVFILFNIFFFLSIRLSHYVPTPVALARTNFTMNCANATITNPTIAYNIVFFALLTLPESPPDVT